MSAVTVLPREAEEWTVADLEKFPDDGLRYELIDGALIVTPAPALLHQSAVMELAVLLRDACPPGLKTFVAPVDFQPNLRTSVQPDVLVISRPQASAKNVTEPPMLAVEVLSPSSRRRDFMLKRSLYEDLGVSCYWIFDPNQPQIWCWELIDGRYVETAHVTANESVTLQRPFPVTVCPAHLVNY